MNADDKGTAVPIDKTTSWLKENAFVINACENGLPDIVQDEKDAESLYDILENEAIPMYYENREKWFEITKNSMLDIIPKFDSNRMAIEYYETLYST